MFNTITGLWEHGFSVTGSATTLIWGVLSARAMAYAWSAKDTKLSVFNYCVCMSTGRKCHGTCLRSAGKLPWKYWSINHKLNRRWIERSSTTPNDTRMRTSPIWRSGRITFFALFSCCLFALPSFIKSRCLTRDAQIWFTKASWSSPGQCPCLYGN